MTYETYVMRGENDDVPVSIIVIGYHHSADREVGMPAHVEIESVKMDGTNETIELSVDEQEKIESEMMEQWEEWRGI